MREQLSCWEMCGDIFHSFLIEKMDHSVGAMGPTRIAAIDRDR
jgi:hypothetical protein